MDVLRQTLIKDLSGGRSIVGQENLLSNKLDNDLITKKLIERGILKSNITGTKEIKNEGEKKKEKEEVVEYEEIEVEVDEDEDEEVEYVEIEVD